MEWRKNRGDSLLRTPSNAPLGRRERLEQRRVWLLHRFGHHRDGTHYPILNATTPFFGGFEGPGRIARGHAPVFAIVSQEIIGPGLFDDAEAFLEGGPVGGIDVIVLMGQRAVNPV